MGKRKYFFWFLFTLEIFILTRWHRWWASALHFWVVINDVIKMMDIREMMPTTIGLFLNSESYISQTGMTKSDTTKTICSNISDFFLKCKPFLQMEREYCRNQVAPENLFVKVAHLVNRLDKWAPFSRAAGWEGGWVAPKNIFRKGGSSPSLHYHII